MTIKPCKMHPVCSRVFEGDHARCKESIKHNTVTHIINTDMKCKAPLFKNLNKRANCKNLNGSV